jgi:hypothetical protein
MQAAMVGLAVLCVAMSAMAVPAVREDLLLPASQSLTDRAGYATRALDQVGDTTTQVARR